MVDYSGQQFGSYRLMHRLKSGGYGDVYLGQHVFLQTKAAIKILQAHLADKEEEKFYKEARIVAQLSHRHIAGVLDFNIQNGTPFLVMQYAAKGNLRQHHPMGTLLSIEVVVEYVKQIASALQYAHDQRVIHLDVKPENLLMGDNGEILLCDFGIAVVVSSSLRNVLQEQAGTVPYMAPEQIQGNAYFGTDQYALGIVVYEWLCGEPPFKGNLPLQVAMQHINEPVPPLRQKNARIIPAVEKVVLKALQKDPAQRFNKVREFAVALEAAASEKVAKFYSDATLIEPSVPGPAPGAVPPKIVVPTPPSPVGQPVKVAQQAIVSAPPAKSHLRVQQGLPRRRFLEVVTGLFILGALAELLAPKVLSIMASTDTTPAATPDRHLTPIVRHHPTPTPTRTVPTTPTSTPYLFYGHTQKVNGVAWSHDTNYSRIASCSQDGTVQIWEPNGGSRIQLPYSKRLSPVSDIAWSPTADYLAFCSGTQVYIWNPKGGFLRPINTGQAAVNAVVWSPPTQDANHYQDIVSAGTDSTLKVWRWNWRSRTWSSIMPNKKYDAEVLTVAWSPDRRYIASGGGDGKVHIYSIEAKKDIQSYSSHTDAVNSVAWFPKPDSANSVFIASGSEDSTVRIWDATTGNTEFNYLSHSGPVLKAAWSPDGTYIASADTNGEVYVWEALTASHTLKNSHRHDVAVNALAWSSDGTMIASGDSSGTVHVWQAV